MCMMPSRLDTGTRHLSTHVLGMGIHMCINMCIILCPVTDLTALIALCHVHVYMRMDMCLRLGMCVGTRMDMRTVCLC